MAKNVEENSKFVNKLLETCNNVIGWGIGVSRTTSIEESKIKWDKFLLLGLRDYNNPLNLPYVPCVSCKLPQLSYSSPLVREVGVIHHGAKAMKIPGLSSFESITNRVGLETFIRFIASSNAIVTSSYHAALWSLWMGKKVVCAHHEWSKKFEYFQYKPEFITDINNDSVYDALSHANIYPNIRQEAIEANDRFFLSVKEIIEKTITKKVNKDYQEIYEIKRMAKLFAWNSELDKKIKGLDSRIKKLESNKYNPSIQSELDETNKNNLVLQSKLDETNKNNLALQSKLDDMHNSTSWKITKPIRNIKRLFFKN